MKSVRGKARRAVQWRARQAAERALEWRYRSETAAHLYLEDLGRPAENRVWHDPSEWIPVRRAFRRLDVRPDDVCVDFGSGLGRALLVAAEFPFARVIGVELSEQMNDVARRNVERNRGRFRARSVEIVTADALGYEIPDDLSVAYMYCPFYGAVFEGVLEGLVASVDRRARPLRLVYTYPAEPRRLSSSPRALPAPAAGRPPPSPPDPRRPRLPPARTPARPPRRACAPLSGRLIRPRAHEPLLRPPQPRRARAVPAGGTSRSTRAHGRRLG